MTRIATVTLAASLILTAGCHVDANKHGDKKSVDIDVPGGSMHIKSDKIPSEAGLGVAVYPGATVDKDNDNANVDMAFGGFTFRVKTVHVSTPDPYDKVKSFYITELQHYGDVLQCHDGKAIGNLQVTDQGLTCEEESKRKEAGKHHGLNFDISSDGQDDLELKAGSKRHQHIVAIGRKGNGTTMQIVALDFPGGLDKND